MNRIPSTASRESRGLGRTACGGAKFLRGMDDDAVHKDQGGKKGTHTVQSGHFPLIFDADGVAVGRHPSAAAGDWVGGVGTVRRKVPVHQEVKREPPDESQRTFTQAHRDRDCGAERAGPNKDLDHVLNHKCELAQSVPAKPEKAYSGRFACF